MMRREREAAVRAVFAEERAKLAARHQRQRERLERDAWRQASFSEAAGAMGADAAAFAMMGAPSSPPAVPGAEAGAEAAEAGASSPPAGRAAAAGRGTPPAAGARAEGSCGASPAAGSVPGRSAAKPAAAKPAAVPAEPAGGAHDFLTKLNDVAGHSGPYRMQ